jgi:hypothetical protein
MEPRTSRTSPTGPESRLATSSSPPGRSTGPRVARGARPRTGSAGDERRHPGPVKSANVGPGDRCGGGALIRPFGEGLLPGGEGHRGADFRAGKGAFVRFVKFVVPFGRSSDRPGLTAISSPTTASAAKPGAPTVSSALSGRPPVSNASKIGPWASRPRLHRRGTSSTPHRAVTAQVFGKRLVTARASCAGRAGVWRKA